jgi:hypothetical protein
MSVRGRVEKGTGLGRLPGPWAQSGAGPDCFPRGLLRVFSSFLPFPFLLSYFFITFAFWVQFDSNQNLKFSNIKNNILK